MKTAASDKLIFHPTVDALLVRGLNDRMTPDFRAKLATLGFDLDKVLPGYPYEKWEQAILAATSLFPELKRAEALEALGARLLKASLESSVSSKLLPLLRVLGVTRALKRALKSGTGENFNIVSFGNETSTSLEISMSFVGTIPEFALGSMKSLPPILGGKNVRGQVMNYANPGATYLLEWD